MNTQPYVISFGCTPDAGLINMSIHVIQVTYIAYGRSATAYLWIYVICWYYIHLYTFVNVRLDCRNAMLCGTRDVVIRQYERVQRQAARVDCKNQV